MGLCRFCCVMRSISSPALELRRIATAGPSCVTVEVASTRSPPVAMISRFSSVGMRKPFCSRWYSRREPSGARPRATASCTLFCVSVSRNSSVATLPRMSFTSAELVTPGSCTKIRSMPCCCTLGSVTPSSFTRLRSVFMFCWMAFFWRSVICAAVSVASMYSTGPLSSTRKLASGTALRITSRAAVRSAPAGKVTRTPSTMLLSSFSTTVSAKAMLAAASPRRKSCS